jgi:hypothetical protein
MSLFAVLLPKEEGSANLINKIKATFPNDNFQITPTQWLISAKGTAKEISEKLGINDEKPVVGYAIILAIAGYWGRGSADLWEWMRVKTEEKG